MIIAASGATLLLSAVCSTVVLAQTQQTQSTATTPSADQQDDASAEASAQTTPTQTQPPQAASTQAMPAQVPSTQTTPVPAAQTQTPSETQSTQTQPTPAPQTQAPPTQTTPTQTGMPPGSIAPGVAPGTVVPGTVTPPGTAVPPPGAYTPQTKYDNTPSRFNMTQDGKRMSADDFDAWMRSKGYRVAKGAPPADCPNAPPAGVETIVGPDGCPVEVSIELDGVTFEFAKSTLRPEARTTLDQAVEILKRHPELTVEVAGHTDSRGASDFNQKLSETRAKAVYDYLIEKGIDAKQLEGPVGYGESKPIASNDTAAGREENRRTELNIKAVAALPAPAAAADAPPVVLPATTDGTEGQATEAPEPAAPAPAKTESQRAAEEAKEAKPATP